MAPSRAGAETAKKFSIRARRHVDGCAVSSEGGFLDRYALDTVPDSRPRPDFITDVFTYDVAKDGKRFLVNRYVKPDHVAPLTILLHAPAGNSSP